MTVTVCGTFQFAAVNVTLAGETVPSVVSLDESGIVTSAVGCEVSTTVKVTDVPASEVEVPLGAPTVIPADVVVRVRDARSAGSTPVVAARPSLGADQLDRVRRRRRRPRASSTPVTVTVCATFQFAVVNVTLAGETVPSVVSLLESATTTSAVGCDDERELERRRAARLGRHQARRRRRP